jgi:hypothetical protein
MPQLTLTRFEGHWVPNFGPLRCSVCQEVIRGSFFHRVGELSSSASCESCFRKSKPGSKSLIKAYKHCILRKAVTGEVSRRICRCSSVARRDPDGRSHDLFPMVSKDTHHPQCGLLNLVDSLTQAKYEAWLLPIEKRLNLNNEIRANEEKENEARAKMKKELDKERAKGQKQAQKAARYGKTGLRATTNSSLVQYGERTATTESTATVEEKEANGDIPTFMKPFTDQYPFGNIHMTLRMGPLLIENGIKQYDLPPYRTSGLSLLDMFQFQGRRLNYKPGSPKSTGPLRLRRKYRTQSGLKWAGKCPLSLEPKENRESPQKIQGNYETNCWWSFLRICECDS